MDNDLRPFVNISMLLASGNSCSKKAQNVNAVMGNTTTTNLTNSENKPAIAMEFLVCTENARQDDASIAELRDALNGNVPTGRKGKLMDGATANAWVA